MSKLLKSLFCILFLKKDHFPIFSILLAIRTKSSMFHVIGCHSIGFKVRNMYESVQFSNSDIFPLNIVAV